MIRFRLKAFSLATTVVALAAATASAGDLGLVKNGDVEAPTLFGPFPTDHPNGYPDRWHHSNEAAWSNGTTDPFVSATHSLFIPDDNADGMANIDNEHRSFALPIPGVGTPGRTMVVSWNWNWDITSAAGDKFSATFRTSIQPVVPGFLDLLGTGADIRDHVFRTDGSATSGGFQFFTANIPLLPAERSFDIIFASGDEIVPASETGVMFVDDIRADIVIVPVLTADFDGDGDVDGDDLETWQLQFGEGPGADADDDGDSDGADFLAWQRQLVSGPQGGSATAAVPEPSIFALAAMAALPMGVVRARRRARNAAAKFTTAEPSQRRFGATTPS